MRHSQETASASDEELLRLSDAYVDGTLDEAGADILVGVLRCGGASARLVRERIAMAGLLGQALDGTDAEAVRRAVGERIDAQGSATAFVAAVGRSIDRRHRRRSRRRVSWTPFLAAAALIVMGLAGWWLLPAAAQAPIPCHVVVADEAATVRRGASSLSVGPGSALAIGDLLHARGGLTVGYADGTRLMLAADSAAVVVGAKTLRLEQGGLEADVAPQSGGRFVIATPVADVEVIGTRFALRADGAQTTLALHEGAVQLVRSDDRRSLAVRAGETALATADGTLALRRSAAPLFPATGLAGWRQQHGVWSNQDGVVRGQAPAGGRARLLSVRSMQDLELTCQLRLSGTHAEIQVGDYNWYFMIGRTGGWATLRLVQRGAELSCTLNGAPLLREPGDGTSMRPGPLSFFVGAGGVLEIRDARIVEP